MPRLRVCHLSKYYPPAPGGIETHVRTLARAQADLGAEVAGLLRQPRLAERRPSRRDGPVEVVRFGRRASGAKLDYCPGLASALAGVEADVLHLQVPNPTMILALLRARPRDAAGRSRTRATWSSSGSAPPSSDRWSGPCTAGPR